MPATKGNKVKIEYTGTFEDGTVFDSSEKHGKPLEFELGAGMVIKGFEAAVEGMEEGEEKEASPKKKSRKRRSTKRTKATASVPGMALTVNVLDNRRLREALETVFIKIQSNVLKHDADAAFNALKLRELGSF